MAIAKVHPHAIPLLLTDVIMPGMNGRELADQFHRLYPAMKMIFMSGYTDRVLADDCPLESKTAYLQKPFTLDQLGEMLRRVQAE
jgi:YesN/AraC family two-component response regulator